MAYQQTERTKQRRKVRRDQILLAAKTLFISQGYGNTTMQHVAKEAQTSIGNLYFYFSNKEALFLAVVEQFSEETGRLVDQAMLSTAPGAGQLAVAVHAGICFTLSQTELARQVLVETTNPTLRLTLIAYFTDRVRLFFKANPSFLGAMDAELVGHAWQSSLFGMLERVLAGDVPNEPDKVGRFLARWNLQALGLPIVEVEQALLAIDKNIQKRSLA